MVTKRKGAEPGVPPAQNETAVLPRDARVALAQVARHAGAWF